MERPWHTSEGKTRGQFGASFSDLASDSFSHSVPPFHSSPFGIGRRNYHGQWCSLLLFLGRWLLHSRSFLHSHGHCFTGAQNANNVLSGSSVNRWQMELGILFVTPVTTAKFSGISSGKNVPEMMMGERSWYCVEAKSDEKDQPAHRSDLGRYATSMTSRLYSTRGLASAGEIGAVQ